VLISALFHCQPASILNYEALVIPLLQIEEGEKRAEIPILDTKQRKEFDNNLRMIEDLLKETKGFVKNTRHLRKIEISSKQSHIFEVKIHDQEIDPQKKHT
jgi:hypothetical protein